MNILTRKSGSEYVAVLRWKSKQISSAASMNRTVKIHSMESKTATPICFRFQVNKCPFGDKCKYRHIKDENFIPRDNKENKNTNGADKKKVTPKELWEVNTFRKKVINKQKIYTQ